MLIDPRGRRLVVDLDNTSTIASFHVRHDGLLVAAPGSPIAAQGAGPFGAEFRPSNPSQLFVSNAHGGAGNGTISAFLASGSTGQLAPIGASPFADLQTAPCWVEISHDGQFLFTVNTGSGTISSYSINPDGSLVLLGSTPFGSAGAGAVDARLSPDGRTLLVDGSKANVDRVVRGERRKPHRAVQLTHTAARGCLRGRYRHRLTIAARRRLGICLYESAAPLRIWITMTLTDFARRGDLDQALCIYGERYPFAGRVRANATPRPTQTPSWRLVANPSGETRIQPFIGRPVMSKTRA